MRVYTAGIVYNILYDRGDGTTSLYLAANCDFRTAELYRDMFKERYVGKPYPNGKGWYPFRDPVIVGFHKNGGGMYYV